MPVPLAEPGTLRRKIQDAGWTVRDFKDEVNRINQTDYSLTTFLRLLDALDGRNTRHVRPVEKRHLSVALHNLGIRAGSAPTGSPIGRRAA